MSTEIAALRDLILAVAPALTATTSTSDVPRGLDPAVIALLILAAVLFWIASRPVPAPTPAIASVPAPPSASLPGGEKSTRKSKKAKKQTAKLPTPATSEIGGAPSTAPPSVAPTASSTSTSKQGRKAKLGCPTAPSVPPKYRGKLTPELGRLVKSAGRCPVCRRPLNKHQKPTQLNPETRPSPPTTRPSSPARSPGPAPGLPLPPPIPNPRSAHPAACRVNSHRPNSAPSSTLVPPLPCSHEDTPRPPWPLPQPALPLP